ncbi:MAG: MarR family winged helix-turn-helix transcriptional regulator [Armatimonas sp.]
MDEDKSLYQEIERTCTLFNLRKATRVVTDLYSEILAPGDIPVTQFLLLVAVKNHGPVSMSKLAEGLYTDRTTLTRTLRPLQEKGWITIGPGQDRRVQEVSLTTTGNATLAETALLWKQAQKQVQEQLGHTAWEELLTHLHASLALKAA